MELRVLLIAHDPQVRKLIQRCARESSWNVTTVDTLSAGVARLETRPPCYAFVFVSLYLPDGHGLNNLLEVLNTRIELPVVAIGTDDEQAVDAVRQGAEDYLTVDELTPARLKRVTLQAIARNGLRRELLLQCLTDELTGLHNRRAFMTLAAQQLAQSRRNRQALLMFYADLDDLKIVNDREGHEAGDRILSLVGTVLRVSFRASDVVARIGGDEFVVLMLENSPRQATIVLERFKANLEAHDLSMSVGFARMEPSESGTIETLMAAADTNLYQNKRARKDMAA